MIRLTWDELIQKCSDYKRCVKAERGDKSKILRASWEGFAAFCGEIAADLTRLLADYAVYQAGQGADGAAGAADGESAESKSARTSDGWDTKKIACCEELLRLATFVRAELATSEYWGGALSLKSSFYQKQDFDGHAMREKEQTADKDTTIKVVFTGAGADPFG